jgi:tetratricopeptide (TPR) repeat protein
MFGVLIGIFLFLALGVPQGGLQAWETGEGFYDSFADFLNGAYGVDENAGLTALPVLNIPMGGKAEAMAGAFAAVADDVSFIEWNPAGSAMLETASLAFFHNNWIADTKIEAAAFSNKLGNVGFGAAAKWLYTPFTEYSEWGVRSSKGYYSEAVGTLNLSYNFFPGYYFPGFALGVNVKGGLRVMPDFAEYASETTGAFAVDVGVLTRINLFKFYDSRDKNMSFALVLRNFGPLVMDDPLPAVAVAGLAYKPFRPLSLSCDLSFPMNLTDMSLSEKPYFAFGLAVAITSFFSMRGGFMIRAGGSRWTIGSAVEMNTIAIEVNYSLDLLTQFQSLNRVTVGVRFNLGDGGRGEKNKLVDALYLQGIESYSNGDADAAADLFNKALDINPLFDPALSALRAISAEDDTNSRIEGFGNYEY